jgi:predicted Rossmann fold flavoprotein
LITGSEIKTIIRGSGFFELTDKTGITYQGRKCILSCGGCAAPVTGSDGWGYRLAETLGHTLIKPLPALVQLKLSGETHKAMEKMLWNAEVSLFLNNRKSRTVSGDIIFTSYGISGLSILDLSRDAVRGLSEKQAVQIEINFLPDLSIGEKIDLLRKRRENHPERIMEHFLTGVINKRISQTLIKSSGIKLSSMASELTENEIIRLAELINGWRFTVTGDTGWANAQVTAGGIDCGEVDRNTLESTIAGGLYLCGEILDIDGNSGGYNLQWAWSSGYVAGKSCASAITPTR